MFLLRLWHSASNYRCLNLPVKMFNNGDIVTVKHKLFPGGVPGHSKNLLNYLLKPKAREFFVRPLIGLVVVRV